MNPQISVIIPCYNEEKTLPLLLDALLQQTLDSEKMEVVIADGMSEDSTREVIRQFKSDHPELGIQLIDNPDRNIPAALNKAISTARGEVVIRLDAHSVPARDYVQRCLEVLQETEAANVGGLWLIQPSRDHWISRSIAAAASHPIGAGDVRYRLKGEAGPVDTVPFGAFPRRWLEQIGPFNEKLLTNEDYEYNVRIRQAGGQVWFDPSIQSMYFARKDLLALARQYSRYGFWKAVMLRRFPASLRWRQALPPLFVMTLLVLSILTLFFPFAWFLLGVQLGAYGLSTMIFGIVEALRRRHAGIALGFILAIWTMHLSWGASFLWGILRGPRTDS